MIRFFTHKNIILYRVMFSLLLLFCFIGAKATVYTVNNTADGNGLNQLRGAILNADATAGSHVINVSAGTYLLTLGSISFGNTAKNITIAGAGATTIIEMSLVSATNRIFLINPPGTVPGVVVSISGCTFKNGRLTGDPYGGGAILCGGPTNSMTISNCLFTGNTINPAVGISNGGAISNQGGGSLTITNTRFENNNVQFGSGGAVDYFLQNFTNLTGSFNISGCTFENNSANVSAGAVGGAIQIIIQGAVSGQSFSGSITKNEFITNAARANGGAIFINNSFSAGNTILVNYNRFKGNTSPENTNTSGLAMANTVGNVNAENNWWACNAGPTGPAGCDKAAQLAGAATGIFDATPWLQLRASANPATICNNSPLNTSTVTASVLANSDGGAVALSNLTVLLGKPISFTNAVLGNISGAQTTIQPSGTATATFTATASGNGSVNAVVDNVTNTDAAAKASITIRQYPVITQQPVADVKCLGVTASFTVQNIGTDPVYQWRKGTVNLVNGATGTGSSLSGVNLATLQIINPSSADAASDYNVVISNACSTATSNNVSLTVNLPPTITNHPAVTTTQCSGTTFNLTAAATGTPTPAFQWRRGNTNLINGPTGNGSTISGVGTNSLTITNIAPADAAANYNVSVSNSCSTVISNNATLIVNVPPIITAQPTVTTTQCSGTTFNLSASATGTPTPAFQWRKGNANLVNGPTGTGSTISGVGTNSLSITNISPADAAADYNVSVSNSCSTVISNNASLTVNVPPTFSVQPPANNVGCSGNTFDISATATGTATITYKWRKGVTDLLDGPTGTGSVISGVGTNNLVINFLTPADNASDYNVVATNGCSSTASDMVLLEVQPPLLPTATSSGSINISPTMHAINGPGCNRIALVVPTAPEPVFGLVNGKVTITATIQVAPPSNKPYVNRHYDLEPANNAAAATATVTLYFTQAEFDLFNAYPGVNFLLPEFPTDDVGKTNLRIYQYHGTGTLPGVNYTGAMEMINPPDNQIIWNATYSRWEVTFNVNGFSGFYASNEDYTILPLNGLEFSGNRFNEKVNLQWLTRNEINTHHFDLERSADGRQFDHVTKVAANGSSSSQRQYKFTDYPGNQPVWYYRLRVVDVDGIITYSKVIMLKSMSTGPISVAPNPFKSHFQVTIRASENSKVQFRLTDVSGRILRTQTNELMIGQNAIMINNLDALPSGTYLLQVMTNKTTETIKLLKGE